MGKILLNGKRLYHVCLNDGVEIIDNKTTIVRCLHDERIPNLNNLDEIGYPYKIIQDSTKDEIGRVEITLQGDYELNIT